MQFVVCFDRFSPYEWDNPHPCNEQEVKRTADLNENLNCKTIFSKSLKMLVKGACQRVLLGQHNVVRGGLADAARERYCPQVSKCHFVL